VAKLVINPRIGMNVVLEEVVWKLGLRTKRHPTPFQLEWLTKGNKVRISNYCQVPFSVGAKYVDHVLTWLTWLRVTYYWANRDKMIKLPSMMKQRTHITSWWVKPN
jgi:hypothetical protein